MTIKFPKVEDNLPPKDEFTAYSHFVDNHLYFLKQQSKCEFFYWKTVGIFFLITLASFILHDKEMIMSPFIVVLMTGLGCILIFNQNIKMDFEYGVKAAACVEKGLPIEKKYNYPVKLFSIFEDNKLIIYRGNLLSRLFPMGLIGLATVCAGILLSLKIGVWLSVVVAIFSIIVVYMMARSYSKTAKRILLC